MNRANYKRIAKKISIQRDADLQVTKMTQIGSTIYCTVGKVNSNIINVSKLHTVKPEKHKKTNNLTISLCKKPSIEKVNLPGYEQNRNKYRARGQDQGRPR